MLVLERDDGADDDDDEDEEPEVEHHEADGVLVEERVLRGGGQLGHVLHVCGATEQSALVT